MYLFYACFNEDLMHPMDLSKEYFTLNEKHISPYSPKGDIPPKPRKISKYFSQWIKELYTLKKPDLILLFLPSAKTGK